jgi:hypothetical protein
MEHYQIVICVLWLMPGQRLNAQIAGDSGCWISGHDSLLLQLLHLHYLGFTTSFLCLPDFFLPLGSLVIVLCLFLCCYTLNEQCYIHHYGARKIKLESFVDSPSASSTQCALGAPSPVVVPQRTHPGAILLLSTWPVTLGNRSIIFCNMIIHHKLLLHASMTNIVHQATESGTMDYINWPESFEEAKGKPHSKLRSQPCQLHRWIPLVCSFQSDSRWTRQPK